MRTLHIDCGREMRGGQWQVLRLLQGLAEGGDWPVLMAREGSPLFAIAKQQGLHVRPLSLLALPQLARESDVVHAHDARSHTLASIFRRAPLVVARRVAFPIGSGAFSGWKYAGADRYIAVSRHVASRLIEGGVREGKVTVAYDGVPLLAPSSRTGPIVTPASSDPLKGVSLVREAAQVLESKNLERDFATASMFLYISESEGLGSAVLLAMSAGIPVVASRIGGIPELIDHGHDGLLVENTRESITAAVRELSANPAFAQQLGNRARQKVDAQFSEASMVKRTRGIYRQVLHHA